MIWLIAYILAIVAANAAITVWGLVPVGPFIVPAGTFFAGLCFGLRDGLHRARGRRWTVLAILIGALLSSILSPALALASGVAFLLSETIDLVVYEHLEPRGWTAAIWGSNIAGGLADTAVFLLLAGFFAWPALIGTTLVKWAMTTPIWLIGARRRVLELTRG